MEYNNIGTAQGRYQQCESLRETFLDRARDSAKLTLPTLIPPSGATGTTQRLEILFLFDFQRA